MVRGKLKQILCWSIIGTHVFAILFSASLLTGFGDPKDAVDLIFIIAPVTGAMVTTIVQYLAAGGTIDSDTEIVEGTAARVFIFLTAVMCLSLVATLLFRLSSGLGLPGGISADHAKIAVGIIETAFGFYVGIFIKKMFAEPAVAPRKRKPSADRV